MKRLISIIVILLVIVGCTVEEKAELKIDPTVEPTVEPTEEPTPFAVLIDSYWGGDYFYFSFDMNTAHSYCEVYIMNGNRRIGEFTNSFNEPGHYGIYTYSFYKPEGEFDGYEIICD